MAEFVLACGTQFTLGGEPFYLAGANCYYLPYRSDRMMDAVFDRAQTIGLKVIRTWAFPDVELPSLDRVITRAAGHGIKLILPLVNNWNDFGNMDQYVQRCGLQQHDDFYSDARARQAFKDRAAAIIARYRSDPAIAAWELANEPRCSSPKILGSWVEEMGSYFKELDPDHLVAVGDEGFFNHKGGSDWKYDGSQGGDFDSFLSMDSIDFGTFHLYPEVWGETVAWGIHWIDQHLNAGAKAGKPVVLEEYGLKDSLQREAAYANWLSRMRGKGGAGDLFWMLAAEQDDGSLYPNHDGYTLYADSLPATLHSG